MNDPSSSDREVELELEGVEEFAVMSMQAFSAPVQNGTIVPDEGIELAEGSRVTVIAREAGTPFELGSQDEAELVEAIAEADRGDVVSAEELFRRLSR